MTATTTTTTLIAAIEALGHTATVREVDGAVLVTRSPRNDGVGRTLAVHHREGDWEWTVAGEDYTAGISDSEAATTVASTVVSQLPW